MYSVYGNVQEQIPHDIPEPLGNPVVTTTFKDANLYHDMITGRAVTGILHLINGTLIDWFSKRQDTVEKRLMEASLWPLELPRTKLSICAQH
jgi:hypothetical protein